MTVFVAKKRLFDKKKKIIIITIMKVIGFAFYKCFERRLISNNHVKNAMHSGSALSNYYNFIRIQ